MLWNINAKINNVCLSVSLPRLPTLLETSRISDRIAISATKFVSKSRFSVDFAILVMDFVLSRTDFSSSEITCTILHMTSNTNDIILGL